MTQTPVAVLGAGPWGRTVVAAIAATPGISLAAVVSSNPATRDAVDPAVRVCPDWREAMENTDAAGVILAIPPMHQPKIAIELIESGLPVMLEKPMAATVDDADAIAAAAARYGFSGIVNHLHVYTPAFAALLDATSGMSGAGTVHAVAGARGPHRTGWSPLWDWAGHDFAMALKAIDSNPAEIRARPEPAVVEGKKRFRNYRIELAFDDGSNAAFHLGNAFERKVREFCVEAGGSTFRYRESEANEISLDIDGDRRSDLPSGVESRPLNAALTAFAMRIRSGGGIEEIDLGARVVRLIDAADEAARSGRPVLLAGAGQAGIR